ncbi:IS30 family transposase [Escherichia coli]|nr:IS30 family transposase [Escherichia coli]
MPAAAGHPEHAAHCFDAELSLMFFNKDILHFRRFAKYVVDRKSRYTIILRLRGKDSVSVNQALTDKFLSLPSELRKSLTWDRGMELARHLEFTVSTGVKVYFCDPQSPWQRGTNENTNGLIRQYFPKKTCLAQYTQHELDLVAAQLNNRPRKTLKFKTPKEIIERGVALTD